MSTYVCSDIHGQYGLYKSMLEQIEFSKEDHLYILGDMIDRGPDGIQILRDASARANVTCLLGNHEHMMWNYLNRVVFPQGEIWLHPSNGGKQTLNALRKLPEHEKESVKKFLADLYLQVEITVEGVTFLLSHSCFLPDYGTVKWRDSSIKKKEVTNVVWYSPWRSYEYADPLDYRKDGRYHIIGHVPVQLIADEYWQEYHMPKMPSLFHDKINQIVNIDLGCALMPVIASNPGNFDKAFSGSTALCVVDLERFARGEDSSAFYIRS